MIADTAFSYSLAADNGLPMDLTAESHKLDLLVAATQQALSRQDLVATDRQFAVWRELLGWPIDVVDPESVRCMEAERYSQAALDRYFSKLDEVLALGPATSLEAVVCTLAAGLRDGLPAVLLLAAHCHMFSLAVAGEAYRQLMQDPALAHTENARSAIERYQQAKAAAQTSLQRAATAT